MASGRTCRATRSGSRGVCPGIGHSASAFCGGAKAQITTGTCARSKSGIRLRFMVMECPSNRPALGGMRGGSYLNLTGHDALQAMG